MAVPRNAFKRALNKLYDYIDLQFAEGDALPIPDTSGVTQYAHLQVNGSETPVWSHSGEFVDLNVTGNLTVDGAAVVHGIQVDGLGTANTGTTAVEYGDKKHRTVVLTVSTTLPAIAGGANLAVGKLLYTLPAGACIVKAAKLSVAVTQSQGNINADTPDIGLGTTIASGVNAVLSANAAFENILTGQTAANCTGTATVKTVADQVLVVETAGAHTVYLNVADGWAASGDAAAVVAGTVVLEYVLMS